MSLTALLATLAKALTLAGMVGLVGVIVGDATIGATVAGVFSIIVALISAQNMRTLHQIQRGVRHTHKILTAPRRALFDDQGKVIGTMIRLDIDEDWMGRVIPPQRAQDAEEETP